MTAEQARTAAEANKAQAMKREYDVIKQLITHYSGMGKRGIHTPTICWPETLEKLAEEGYKVGDTTITWA